jgi:hypothetical protein
MTNDSLADFWLWYESASRTERQQYEPPNDFGRERYPEANWPEWTLSDESQTQLRAWPRGLDDPGGRALTGADRPSLAQRLAEYQHAYSRWLQRE